MKTNNISNNSAASGSCGCLARNDLLICVKDMLSVAGVLFLVLDTKGTVLVVNQKGSALLGYGEEEMLNKNWFQHFVPAECRKEAWEHFRKVMEGHLIPVETQDTFVLTQSEDVRLIHWNNLCIKDQRGKTVAMLRSGEDITAIKVLQQRLAVHELEKRKQVMAATLEAQERERFEIANELHDGVNQILTTCKLLLEVELQQGASSQLILNSYQHLQEAINEIRNLSHRLNPAQLEDIGLFGSLKELAGRINRSGKLMVHVHYKTAHSSKDLDLKISLTIFRIVQEQIKNIIKHAGADRVEIQFNLSDEAVELEISDNGKGFDKTKVIKGLGLKNIYNRVELYNGRTIINSSPGEGCTLSIFIPLK